MNKKEQEIDARLDESLCEDCLYRKDCSLCKDKVKSCRHFLPKEEFDPQRMEWLE